MNQTRLASALGSHKIQRSFCLVVVLFWGGIATGYSQTPNAPTRNKSADHPSPPNTKQQPGPGYLSKAPPPGLRFASPPKPPVAYLPPLPITFDPQPVFSSEFAPPTTEVHFPHQEIPQQSPPAQTTVPLTSLISNFSTNRSGQIPATPVDMGSLSPQMLVRFFQNGKVGEVELLLTNAVNFRVPVRDDKPSSSATYEVK